MKNIRRNPTRRQSISRSRHTSPSSALPLLDSTIDPALSARGSPSLYPPRSSCVIRKIISKPRFAVPLTGHSKVDFDFNNKVFPGGPDLRTSTNSWSASRIDFHRSDGKHHAVHLGDLFDNGRYRISHNLADISHSCASTWLARDLCSIVPVYVSLKILGADYSKLDCTEMQVHANKEGDMLDPTYIRRPLRSFHIQGPNGSHLCFVYPPFWHWADVDVKTWSDVITHLPAGSATVTCRNVATQNYQSASFAP